MRRSHRRFGILNSLARCSRSAESRGNLLSGLSAFLREDAAAAASGAESLAGLRRWWWSVNSLLVGLGEYIFRLYL